MARHRTKKNDGQLRIIAGRWRGRRLRFPEVSGLRPTGDRIRETLFNWLAPHLPGAHCLDLFAGSGALGLEALSRGAAHCDFVDSDARAVQMLREHLLTLDAQDLAQVLRADALDFLAQRDTRAAGYDIVFLDPPFAAEAALASACAALAGGPLLAAGARIYLEYPAQQNPPALPPWTALRDKRGGNVRYALYAAGGEDD